MLWDEGGRVWRRMEDLEEAEAASEQRMAAWAGAKWGLGVPRRNLRRRF